MAVLPKILFDSLTEALSYRDNCPICNTILEIGQCVDDVDSRVLDFGRNKLCVKIKDDTPILVIDIKTEEMTINHPSFNSNAASYNSGTLICGFMKDCRRCDQYHFMLYLELDLTNKVINKRMINSEFLVFEVDHIFHEIKLNFVRKETKYQNDRIVNPVILPLIPLDVYNPSAALVKINKIKSLI